MSLRLVVSSLARALKNPPRISRFDQRGREGRECARTGIFLYSSDCPAKCWQCDYPFKSEFFCQKCKALQEPPDKLNYFQIIGVEESYDLDGKELRRKYRELQNILHPDRFGNKSEKEKRISEGISSMLNKAYNTLAHPLERGLYMLRLKNLSVPEGTTSLDPNFLMEIMERNEKVDEASKDGEKVAQLWEENETILDELSGRVSKALAANDWDGGKLILVRMKYYASLQTRLKKLKQELGIVD